MNLKQRTPAILISLLTLGSCLLWVSLFHSRLNRKYFYFPFPEILLENPKWRICVILKKNMNKFKKNKIINYSWFLRAFFFFFFLQQTCLTCPMVLSFMQPPKTKIKNQKNHLGKSSKAKFLQLPNCQKIPAEIQPQKIPNSCKNHLELEK